MTCSSHTKQRSIIKTSLTCLSVFHFLFSSTKPHWAETTKETATQYSMPHERNPGTPLDLAWVSEARINLAATQRRAAQHKARRSIKVFVVVVLVLVLVLVLVEA